MGYLGNHLATAVTGVFAAVLTVLWPVFVDFAPVLDFVFIMAVPIMWFLVFTCWIAQKSADYMHSLHHHQNDDDAPAGTVLQYGEKKSLTVAATGGSHKGTQSEIADLQSVQSELAADLEELKESLKLKDSEIERLNRQIANLQTLVQIETLKAELANLKMLASKHKK
ncbi:MAG: hypothetical protein OXP12_05360 [Thaumarchaeota archaeon]|nr:hypothetical protein [Nitrososphaerota archaeon]MDE0265663.1 hypothetical protein [Nitrososphaerota archaeon]MDE0525988.1 hypothetical protein [Nitrososphaerota archaeon]